jgi:tryptophan halogenase
MKILVLGGGTAGLISGLILKKFLNAQVDVVYSKDIGIIGVGEGSTEHFKAFLKFMGIDKNELIKKTNATYKAGTMFQDWTKKPYLHTVSNPFQNKISQYNYVYAKQISEKNKYIAQKYIWENKIPIQYLAAYNEYPFNQFHFNTHMLNEFLTEYGKNIGIKFFEDTINNIVFKNSGEIDYLVGKKQNYHYDFYIDATGFKKLLIGKMGAEWVSFSKYLKMKSAIVFPTPDEEEYNLWTLAKAMDYGWRFKIPTWGRHGNGYIFDSDYITADQAKEELDKEFGFDVEISKQFNFDPGHLDKVWIKNCVAVGLSGSFVEPLEATSIGTSIQQSFLLMNRILNYTQKEIDLYNKEFTKIMENIRDFIFLHYVVKKNNSIFWKDVEKQNMPDSLCHSLDMWKHRLPIEEDFIGSKYFLFWDANFIVVMYGLEILNEKSIMNEYKNCSNIAKNEADILVSNEINFEKFEKTVSHKNFIKFIRENL